MINVRGRLMSFEQPVVMGILNVTPDSFFDGGKYIGNSDAIRARLDQIMEQGAAIVDMGAYSSRPGAADVDPEEEWRRLALGFEVINKYYPDAIVSVDTFRAEIARRSVREGNAAIINDIAGGDMDGDMFQTIADLHVPYILMHMKGTPQNMQNAPSYANVTEEVIHSLSAKTDNLRRLGVSDIIIDPGFGFGKTVEHNYELMRNLKDFSIFDMPLLVGISRKSMIYKVTGSTPQESLNGTTVLNTLALLGGADILRVHDVREAVECVKLYEHYKND